MNQLFTFNWIHKQENYWVNSKDISKNSQTLHKCNASKHLSIELVPFKLSLVSFLEKKGSAVSIISVFKKFFEDFVSSKLELFIYDGIHNRKCSFFSDWLVMRWTYVNKIQPPYILYGITRIKKFLRLTWFKYISI